MVVFVELESDGPGLGGPVQPGGGAHNLHAHQLPGSRIGPVVGEPQFFSAATQALVCYP
jgi:hypothetical protein